MTNVFLHYKKMIKSQVFESRKISKKGIQILLLVCLTFIVALFHSVCVRADNNTIVVPLEPETFVIGKTEATWEENGIKYYDFYDRATEAWSILSVQISGNENLINKISKYRGNWNVEYKITGNNNVIQDVRWLGPVLTVYYWPLNDDWNYKMPVDFFVDGNQYSLQRNYIVIDVNPDDYSIHSVYAQNNEYGKTGTTTFSFIGRVKDSFIILTPNGTNSSDIVYIVGDFVGIENHKAKIDNNEYDLSTQIEECELRR